MYASTTSATSNVMSSRNLSNVSSEYMDTTYSWPHVQDSTYQSYSHYPNLNLWNQFYYQPNAYDAHATHRPHDYRHSALPENVTDESNFSSYQTEIEGEPLSLPHQSYPPTSYAGSPFVSAAAPLYPIDTLPFPNSQQTFGPPAASVFPPHQQYPIRPIPQQPAGSSRHQCKACLRFCVSAGGLKRHAKFCKASQPNDQTIFSSIANQQPQPQLQQEVNRVIASSELLVSQVQDTNFTVNAHPINLSSLAVNSTVTQALTALNGIPTEITNAPMLGNQSCTATSTTTTSNSLAIEAHRSNDETSRLTTPEKPNGKPKSQLSSTRKKNCPHCPMVLTSERALVEHLGTHNIKKPYVCPTCGSRFSRKFHLTRHAKQRGCGGTPRAQYPCELCSKTFTRKDNLREHIKNHVGLSKPRKKLPCPLPSCKKEFTGQTQLQIHLNYHSGLKPFVCPREFCGKSFRSNAALKKHLLLHTGYKLHECMQCGTRFSVKESQDLHIATHAMNVEPPKVCARCGNTFNTEEDLKERVTVDNQSEKTYTCTLCCRKYRRHWRLKQHYRLEHKDKQQELEFEKEIAEKNSDSSKVVSLRTQLDHKRTYYCDVCKKGFASRQSLKVHYLTHPVESPVSCTECSKSFTRRACLLQHLKLKHFLPSNLAIQAIQAVKNPNLDTSIFKNSSNLSTPNQDTCGIDANNNQEPENILPTYPLLFLNSTENTDVSALEGNIIELLSLLVDSTALKNFGWPQNSADAVLQAVLKKCGKQPVANQSESLIQRLRSNVKLLFSFIVDDQAALETLFVRRSIENVLQQVIHLAKSNENNNNVVQLPI